jgi:hypothetical protein
MKFNGRNLSAGPLSEPGLRAFLPRQEAVVAAMEEINDETGDQPDGKPQPCIAGQAEHQKNRRSRPERRHW